MEKRDHFEYVDQLNPEKEYTADGSAAPDSSWPAPETGRNKRRNKKQLLLLGAAFGIFLLFCGLLWGFSGGVDQSFPVYITEIVASNTMFPNRDGRCCDYIEIYNSADHAVDISGFQLGDVAGSSRYRFPAGTVIDAGSYLVVYCNKEVSDPAYAPFGISRGGGEQFYLIGTNNAAVDSVLTLPMDADQAMVRDANGEWTLANFPSPGSATGIGTSGESFLHNAAVSPIRITEFSSGETAYSGKLSAHCDWVELFNSGDTAEDISGYILTDNLGADKYHFPSGTILGPGEYLVVLCSAEISDPEVARFGLSQTGEEAIALKNAAGLIVQLAECPSMGAGESAVLNTDDHWVVTKEFSPGFPNDAAGHEAYLAAAGLRNQTVVISEIMSASHTVLADCFDDFSDWVELYNSSSNPVDLSGWYLSDNPDDPFKWIFPQLVIQPGQRVVIHCSGKDTVSGNQIHTGFSLSSTGETLVLSSFLGSAVDTVRFDKAEENCSFIRSEPDGQAMLTPQPTPGYSNDAAGYEQFCAGRTPSGPLAIWEVMTANDLYLPQNLGECYDWVELCNISGQPVNLSGYSLTDDPDAPELCILPDRLLQPGEKALVLLSGDETLSDDTYPHAGFSLNARSDRLLLYSRADGLVDYACLQNIPYGHSYGRSSGTGGFFYMTPTPGEDNLIGARSVSVMPTSDIAPGVYTLSEGVSLPFSAEGDIYYTTDGSEPDISSLKYTGPIPVDKTTVIRAVSIEPGKLPSSIYTATFVIQEPHSLPVVSLVTDPDNLWGSKGMYKDKDLSVKELKYPGNIAYSGADGSFSIDCEVSMHGNSTLTRSKKKSFALQFKDAYDGPLRYDVFEDGEVTTFSALALRTSYEGDESSLMRDNLMHQVAAECSDAMIIQKHKYAVVYLNGEYWGLYALREIHSETHYASYANVPASTVTIIKNFILPDTAMYPIFQRCQTRPFRSEADYQEAKTLFHLESFADWIIFQTYSSNIDLTSNVRYYHSPADGLWRCGLVDLDYGLLYGNYGFKDVAECFHHGIVMSALLANEEFQDLLATRLASYLSGPLSDEAMLASIDEMADSIRSEIPRERARWGGDIRNWESTITHMKKYCTGRSAEMIDSICLYLGFNAQEKEHYFGSLLK